MTDTPAPRPWTVRIRRDINREIRPEAEQLDGRTFRFSYGWLMDDTDPYPGEVAWCPEDPAYPRDAPTWIASGDLILPSLAEAQRAENGT